MPTKPASSEVICNTSPLQYLHQAGCLELLPALAGLVIVPTAVRDELEVGRAHGIDLPILSNLKWVRLKEPVSAPALPLAADLGAGESAVLALALESPSSMVILDDSLGRRVAGLLEIPLTGTLGVLLDAKNKGLIPSVKPLLDALTDLGFRLSPSTRIAVLTLANES